MVETQLQGGEVREKNRTQQDKRENLTPHPRHIYIFAARGRGRPRESKPAPAHAHSAQWQHRSESRRASKRDSAAQSKTAGEQREKRPRRAAPARPRRGARVSVAVPLGKRAAKREVKPAGAVRCGRCALCNRRWPLCNRRCVRNRQRPMGIAGRAARCVCALCGGRFLLW